MSQDSAEGGYFLAALNSFVTRTCYANAGGEHSHCTASVALGSLNQCHRHPQHMPNPVVTCLRHSHMALVEPVS